VIAVGHVSEIRRGCLAIEFEGNLDDLTALVERHGFGGSWATDGQGKHSFRPKRGGVLNYWESTGRIQCQGPADKKAALEGIFLGEPVAPAPVPQAEPVSKPRRQVFVVYGHDKEARDQLESMIRRWGLEPLILDQLPSKGQTIIEKLEEYTGEVDFAIVLATPDDIGYRKTHEDEKAYRARQNVVLELGMLLIKLGRPKVAILLRNQEEMERPSDIQGLIYIPFKTDLQKEVGPTLAKEMAALGYTIDVKDL
jgi:predicted nucleotide-binding protein